jgi:hypothetical protein
MTSLVMIFVVAFVACGLIHLINQDSALHRAEARALSQNILTGAWVLALLQIMSLARITS